MTAVRSTRGFLVAGIGGVVLIATLFLSWYSASASANGVTATVTVDAWHALTSTRWILLLFGLSTVGLSCAAGVPALLPAMERNAIARALRTFGVILTVAVLYRLIDIPTGNAQVPAGVHLGRAVGPFIALLAAIAIVVGGVISGRRAGPVTAPSTISA